MFHLKMNFNDEAKVKDGENMTLEQSKIFRIKHENYVKYRISYEYDKLIEIKGIENLNSFHMTDMVGILYGCKVLENSDISKYDPSKILALLEISLTALKIIINSNSI